MTDVTVTDGAENKKEVEVTTNDGNDTDKSGVLFSDSDEFKCIKAMVTGKKLKKQKNLVLKVMYQCLVLPADITSVIVMNSKKQRN